MKIHNYDDPKFITKYGRHARMRIPIFIDAFKKILGELNGKRILDIGCGDGQLTAELAKCGARITAIDPSREMIQTCKENYGGIKNIEFRLGKAQSLDAHNGKGFDAVLITLVLVHIKKRKELARIFREAARVLKRNGTLIFTGLHPVYFMILKNHRRYYTFCKGFTYKKEGARFVAHVQPDEKTTLAFENTNWPLETYSDLLAKAGFSIHHIGEPKSELSKKDNKYELPSFIIFGCKKIR